MMSLDWTQRLDSEGKTALDRAYDSGHRAIAEMLLRQEKEDQNPEDRYQTPMHRAAHLGLVDAVKSLLLCGFEADTFDKLHETPLHLAVRGGHVDVVEALIKVCDANAVDQEGMTPLHWASIVGDAQIVDLLMSHDADPNLRDESLDGLTPVELAEMMGHDELLEALSGEITYY